jgi:hypothetical protein
VEIPVSLQDRLDALKADFEGNKAPAEVVAVMRKATAGLIASGQAEKALKAGMRAPELALPDAHGQVQRSAELLRRPDPSELLPVLSRLKVDTAA